MKLISLLYNKVNWANKPSTNTPINATNLGKMDAGIDNLTKALTDNNVSFNFGYDGTNYGYYKNGQSTLTPFKTTHTDTKTISATGTTDMGVDHKYRYVSTSGLMQIPTATKSITSNGNNQDVKDYAKVNVSVHPDPTVTGLGQGGGGTSISVTLSGYKKYIIVSRGFDSTPAVSGCGATHLYTLLGQRHGVSVYLCTSSGTATITTANGIEGYCVIGITT